MRIDSFDWDEINIEHIARHQVMPDEAEEVFESKYYLLRSRSGRYLALGRNAVGRHLTCIIEKISQPNRVRIITARDMNQAERKLFKRKVM